MIFFNCHSKNLQDIDYIFNKKLHLNRKHNSQYEFIRDRFKQLINSLLFCKKLIYLMMVNSAKTKCMTCICVRS
jgi:hypothetical protein